MKFKKTPVQGNFIFSNGTQAVFVNGIYETEDENEISQLSAIYSEASEEDLAEQQEVSQEQPAVAKGMASSATLAALTKATK